jgi:probable addiction module antidote protein
MAVKLIAFDAAVFLKDERTIAEYLNASVETGDPDVMLSALSAVARARGMAELAEKAGVNRESLYKALAPGAKPRYDTIFRVARALGVEMVFRVLPSPSPSPAARKSTAAAAGTRDRTTTRKTKPDREARASARTGERRAKQP